MTKNVIKIIGFVCALFSVTNMLAQSTIKDIKGLPVDSLGVKLSIGKTISTANGKNSISSKSIVKSKSTIRKTVANRKTVVNRNAVVNIPISYTVDKTKDVGEIPCSSGTTPVGAMTVSVPIEGYRNPDGLTPQVGLTYNSMAGSGPLGWGWSVSGVSVISRGNQTIYYDNESNGVVGNEGAFYIDGQRLILISASSAVLEFQTERGFIKAYGRLSGSSVVDFTVYSPDGSKVIYGITDGLNYYETQMTDKAGHTITYSYTEIDNHYRIKQITYGESQQAWVAFSYTDNVSDVRNFYVNGVKYTYNYLLASISTCLYGSTLRKYSFSYLNKGNVSLISQIDCTSNNKSLNPLKFYYGLTDNQDDGFKGEDSQLLYWYNYNETNQIRTVKGKFDYGTDNDGIMEFPNKISYLEYYRSGGTFRHSRNYFENQYNADDTIFASTGLSDNFSTPNPIIKTENGFVDIFCMDLDKFEGEEIIKVNNYVLNESDRVDFHVYTANLYSGIATKYTRSYDFNTLLDHRGTKSINPKYYYTGDFNGDGKMEVLVVSASNALGCGLPSRFYMIDLENNKILYEGSPFSLNWVFPAYGDKNISGDDAYAQSDKLYAIDYDGDGKTDLCRIGDNGVDVYTFDCNGTSIVCRKVATDSQLTNSMLKGKELLQGEFNGDGKTDFILSPPKNSGTVWNIYSSKGNGYWDRTDVNITTNDNDSKFMLQDMNGDGQADLVETNPNKGSGIHVFGKDYINVYYIANQKYIGEISTNVPLKSILIPTNIQSRNYYSKLLCLKAKGQVTRLSTQRDDSKNRLLSGIINSYGVINKVDYHQLNDESYAQFYSKGYGANFPYCNYNGGLTVCTNLSTYNNGDLLSNIYYSYTDAIIHKQGLGLRGFEKILATDNVTHRSVTQTYDPMRFSVLVGDDSNNESNAYTYSVDVASNKIANVLLTQKVTTDKAKNVTDTTKYEYDSYGNNTLSVTDYGNGLSVKRTNTYLNRQNMYPYLLGLLLEGQVATTRGGGTSNTRTVMTYNNQYFPSSKTDYVNMTNKVREEEYWYNAQNRLIRTGTKLYSSLNEDTVSYTYNSNGQMETKTDPLGLTETYHYNGEGLLYETDDHKGNMTTNQYDVWGRKIKTTYPDKTFSTTQYDWSLTPQNALVTISNSSTGKPLTKTFLDAMGRKIRESELHYDSTFIYTDNIYDEFGRIEKTSYPFRSTPTLWKEYTYDSYDRVTNVSYASTKKDTYSYDGLSSTETVNNISTKRTYNELGDLVSVSDATGTISYNYRPDGQISSIVAPGNIITSYEYDEFGRQTKMTDPSAGTETYTYDPAGNMNSETYANGKVVNMSYDAHNRIIKREFVGDVATNYTYNSDGNLASAQGNNGTSKTYVYDNLFRVNNEKETSVDGKWLQKVYSYYNGNVSTVDYTAQSGHITSENYIYANGSLSEIKLNGTTSVWKITGEDEKGLLSSYSTGILNRNLGYDTDGRLTSIKASANNNVIQSFEYNIDPLTGNLNWREDDKRSITEKFGYDNLNRLTSIGNQTVTYDEKGNITNSSNVGSFEYSKEKPYAVEAVTPTGNMIPLRNQTVSYNSMLRPLSISENGYTATFSYNGDADRVKMELQQGTADKLVRYYIDDIYELDQTPSGTKEKFYVGGDAYSAKTVLINNGDNKWNIYYLCRDCLGSITHITDESGNIVQELSYDAWGNLRDPNTQTVYKQGEEPELFLGRGYCGHEHLAVFGLINMNARLYDSALGRFLSPDPYVQEPDNTQDYNRYSYCLNNPLRYVDQSGELFGIDDLLIGIGVGAIIGAATSAAIYSVQTLATGQTWNWNSFGRSACIGAVGGAIGGGFGTVGMALGSFGQSLGYSVLSNVAGSAATTLAFGGNLSFGSVVGMIAGGVVGAGIGSFTGVSGGAFKNAISEMGYNMAKGAIVGGFGGALGAVIEGGNIGEGFLRGSEYGMIAAGTITALNIMVMGATYKPARSFGNSNSEPVFRRGNFLFHKGDGLTIGRNLITKLRGDSEVDKYIQAHETGHYYQQSKIGFANFYFRVAKEYLTTGFYKSYDICGTLEFGANIYSLKAIEYFLSDLWGKIDNTNYERYYPGCNQSIY